MVEAAVLIFDVALFLLGSVFSHKVHHKNHRTTAHCLAPNGGYFMPCSELIYEEQT